MNAKGDLKASEFSIAEARRIFPSLIREAENAGARTTRHGKPVALLIGHRQLERIGSEPTRPRPRPRIMRRLYVQSSEIAIRTQSIVLR